MRAVRAALGRVTVRGRSRVVSGISSSRPSSCPSKKAFNCVAIYADRAASFSTRCSRRSRSFGEREDTGNGTREATCEPVVEEGGRQIKNTYRISCTRLDILGRVVMQYERESRAEVSNFEVTPAEEAGWRQEKRWKIPLPETPSNKPQWHTG